ncbi:MAG: ABC transporter ATP-binding protein [Deltaproteobacteria bacterium]|nr:ABC transporter ATP-binding protein [Deltaproteobacteria bacterium]
MLEIKNIDTYYGRARALENVSLGIEEKSLVTILGANGSGKSTLLNTISGILKPAKGTMIFEGQPISSLSTDAIVKLGISQCPEGRRLFPEMTVMQNLRLGAYVRRADREGVEKDVERVCEFFPVLRERRDQFAGTMSGGEQQMLAIGRALMCRPKLLLLDEPSLGLAPLVVAKIFEVIQEINQSGTAICLVEQNASMAIKIASKGYVLESGTIVLAGTREELQEDPKVKKAYLGV